LTESAHDIGGVGRKFVFWECIGSYRDVTSCDPEVMSFDRRRPGFGWRRPKLMFWECIGSYRDVTHRR